MPGSRTNDPREDRAGALLADYLRDGRTRTDLLKELAVIIVELREEHHIADGRPDLAGRSAPYRAAIARIYERARMSSDAKTRDAVQTAIRYHVGNLLRERYSEDELAAAGLSNVSPKDRRDTERGLLTLIGETLRSGKDDPRVVVAAALSMLEQIEPEHFERAGSTKAKAAKKVLQQLDRVAVGLISEVDARYPARTKR